MNSQDIYRFSQISKGNRDLINTFCSCAKETYLLAENPINNDLAANIPAFVPLIYSGRFTESFSMIQESDSFKIIFADSGSLTLSVNQKTYTLNTDSVTFISDKLKVTISPDKENGADITIICLIGTLPQCYFNILSSHGNPLLINNAGSLYELTGKLKIYIENKKSKVILLASHAVSNFFTEFYFRAQENNDINDTHEKVPEWFNSVLNEIQKHPEIPTDAKIISQKYGISESSVYRTFLKFTKLSPVAYLDKHRIQKAILLLTSTNLQIKYIASSLGFNSASNFSQKFKESTGKTPRSYRNKNIS